MREAKRTTFAFSPAVDEKLTRLANQNNTSKTEILRRAISLYEYLGDNSKGGRVRIERKDGTQAEIILP